VDLQTSLSNTNNKEWQNELLKIKAGLQTKGSRYNIEIIATALSIFSDTYAVLLSKAP
jgi:hypothetical protein